MTALFTQQARYYRAIEAIAALKPCIFSDKLYTDAIKTILGEVADVWLNSIEEDEEDDALPVGAV